MRTGAIFARGSCRALKWLALFGVVFALGAGSAAAQATFTGAEWTPESNMIKINMSAAVWSRSPNDAAGDFEVTWGAGADAMEATGTASTIPGTRGGAATEFTITLDKVVPTGAGGADGSTGITVAYTAPTADDDVNDRGILDNSAAHAPTADNGTITVTENTAVAPMVPPVDPMMFRNGEEIDAFQLPEAKGNAAFTYLVSNLPAGLTWDDLGDDDAAGGTGVNADRMIEGTPSAVTDGDHMVTYTVTDRVGQATSVTFTITVNDVPDMPDMPTVTPTTNTAGSLDVMWDAPADNNSAILYYQVQYKETDATDWMVPPTNVMSGTSKNFTGLTDGTSYDFQVQAVNGVGMSGWSDTGMGTPMMSGAVPDAPAMPTVTATANTRGSLDVMWDAPADNGSAITGYGLRYRVKDTPNWTVMTDAIATTSMTLAGMPAATTYEVQVNARNANGESAWSASGEGTTAAAPSVTVRHGQITEMKVTGGTEKTIGGTKRVHVAEGATDVEVSITVQWDHAELTALYGAADTAPPARIWLRIQGNDLPDQDRTLPDWVSWIDDEGDVDFPNAQTRMGELGGWIDIPLPKKPKANEFPDSIRHHRDSTGEIRLLIHHDEHEAENDAFYIDATYSEDVDLDAASAVERTTPLIVIEDDEKQGVTVLRNKKASSEFYENQGSAEFIVTADPPRIDLPLDVRLDVEDVGDATVKAATFSVSDANLTLNAGRDGTSNSATVEVRFPNPDGNREDDEYELRASVVLYSLSSGAFDTIVVEPPHEIDVYDIHRLPPLSVSPATGTVKEGEEIELTLTIDRNPADTIAIDPETRRYTSEAIDVMLTAGAGTTADMGDYQLPATVKFEKHDGKTPWMQEMKVKVMAMENNELDDERMLVLDAMVAGTEAKNGEGKDTHMEVSALSVEDATKALVWAKTDEEIQAHVYGQKEAGMGADGMFNPGEMIEITSSALFNAAEGVTLSYTAMSDNEDVATVSVSGGMATVMAEDMAGVMAHITITAHASMPAGAMGLPQTDPREASVIFPVEVGLAALSIELSGPEEMNLVEGGMGGMVTATANRRVTADTMVTLMRDRAKSSADDMDYTADPITIVAGQMSGSTMVMATPDDMMENMDNMPEELVLYGMTEGMEGEVTGEVKFYLWDAAVPALPIIAQLLLAAFLAIGGYRRYRRR